VSDDISSWLFRFVHEQHFLQKYAYYPSILSKLDAIHDPGVDVMGVSLHGGRFYLHTNIDFFVANPGFITGVLLHEVHHIVLGHLSHPKFHGPAFPDLMELAMEVSANEFIEEPLPGSPVTWKDFPQFGIGPGQSTMHRYELLATARRNGNHICADGWVDSHLTGGVSSVEPGTAQRCSGVHARVTRLVEEAIAEAAGSMDLPGPKSLLAGRDPGDLLEELTGTDGEPSVQMDWKTAIQMFIGLIRAPIHVYSRPNRRFPGQTGIVPGRMFYPTRRENPSLLVAIDTSASMSPDELTEIARHLNVLSDLVCMTVVECDVRIQRVYRFRGTIDRVAGRGGTDLRPVFEPQFLRDHRPDGVIYFTDGLGPYPESDPGVKTLWVLVNPVEFDCPWGTKCSVTDPSIRPRRPQVPQRARDRKILLEPGEGEIDGP
jgi:predicted metal-dependent peptidase